MQVCHSNIEQSALLSLSSVQNHQSARGRNRIGGRNKSSSDEIPERDVTYHLLCLCIYH